ncbi:hypothetical protein IEQ34_000186 [Dendrobium chrysotoxum]|uniref:BAG family molecular chaperone regulator 7 n=1 Tax=Dendrobium chrysotoxum TaxID=161865 RepID=A0AAV7HSF6_DENCH|nr:hypothetical protein IEQ34_000186 [Dendrobium chrysotoxum]
MSFSRRFDLFESYTRGTKPSFLFPSPLEMVEVEWDEQVGFALDMLSPSLCSKSSFFDLSPVHSCFFDTWASDLASISFQPFVAAVRRAETEIQLQSLSNRIAALEVGFDRAIGAKTEARDRKFKWTAEIKGQKEGELDRKYRLVAEAKTGGERSVKWTTDVKGKGSYTFEASTAPAAAARSKKENEKEKKGEKIKKKGTESSARLVEIDEEPNPGEIVIRKAFAKKVLVSCKGKRKELSPQDAAVLIQVNFRAYLVRRSQVIRGLRELAVAKAKLKEIRSLFNNFSYRRRIARDTEEQQRFTEKIIVLLLTVEAIQGPDYMMRAAKKSIIDELEIMLEVVDPQPATGKLGSLRRRKFDLPDGVFIPREIARNVAQVVELIDEHGEDGAEAGASA